LDAFIGVETNDYGNGKLQQFVIDIEGLEAVYMV
jgi:hypothetical protein